MINEQTVLALIPARGGSKGFPGKNLAKLADRSLIEWAVSAAKSSRYIDRVVLSTDSIEIAAEGRHAGAEVPFLRPGSLATDMATSESVAKHALEALGFSCGLLVLLQPTSPLRTAEDIDACIELASQTGSPGCVSVLEIEKSPYWMFRRDDQGRLVPFIPATERPHRRQNAPAAFVLNGAVYVVPIASFLATGRYAVDDAFGYVMPRERSIDIDYERDLVIAEQLLRDVGKS